MSVEDLEREEILWRQNACVYNALFFGSLGLAATTLVPPSVLACVVEPAVLDSIIPLFVRSWCVCVCVCVCDC
jgi:hypothetical protein